jgi:hypothetical protein
MASLSNINGLFDVHSTGAILFSTSHGTSGQILQSSGNAAPIWVNASTIVGGPYLPLSGGTLTGPTSTSTGISFTVGGNLIVNGASATVNALSATTGSFSGNVTAPTFNGLAINTSGTNNVANQIVRTEGNGYVNFGWIQSTSGNHTGSITRITASNDQYLRYVTPAQFRVGVTDGYYAPTGTVSGVTSVSGTGTVSGLTLTGTVTSTGNITLGGAISGFLPLAGGIMSGNIGRSAYNSGYQVGGYNNIGASHAQSNPIHVIGTDYTPGTTTLGNMYGIGYTRADASFMGVATGSGWGMYVAADGDARVWLDGSNGNISAAGVIYASGGNSNTWNTHTSNTGTVTSVATGNGLTGGTITSTGTLSMSGTYSGTFQESGAHGSSQIGCQLPAANNGANTGVVNLRMWCSEPGVTWDWAGFGYNVTNDNGSPSGFGRLNTAFGQAYQRYSTTGDMYFYNTNTSGARVTTLTLNNNGQATFGYNVTAPTFVGALTGNATTSTTFNTGRTNYYNVTNNAVIGQMMWKNYGNNHTIFDASQSTSPSGSSVNNTNSNTAWTGSYPTLMGWNGSSTYGVRVDSARIADSAANQGNYLPLAGGTMSGDIIFNSNIRLEYSSTHWITPRDTSGNMHLYISSAGYGIYLDSPFTYIRQQGSEGNNIYIAGGAITSTGIIQSNASVRSPLFYDSNNTTYYGDFASTNDSINIAGSLRAATYNKPAIISVSSGTTSAGASIAIQQETAEGWTAIFADFEPNTGWGLYHDNPSNHFLVTSESSSGAIGAGFTVPSRVSGNRTAYTKQLFDQTTGDFKTGRDGYAQTSFRAPIFYDSTNTAYYTRPASSSYINSLETAGSIQAGTSGTGNIYVGGTSSNYFRFHVNSAVGAATFFDMNSGNINWRQGSSTRYIFYSTTANMTIYGTLTQGSDIRIKENIVEISDCIDKVKSIRGVYYNRTDFNTEPTKIGVIAQEVEKQMPELVHDEPTTGIKSVSYTELTAILVNAIKEQQVIIDDLKLRIEKLEL